jgi:hypothetical protein
MSIELLERAAGALGPLAGDLMFVGGATIVLWITDPGAPPPRPTKDVDAVLEVQTRAGLHAFEHRIAHGRVPRGPAEQRQLPLAVRIGLGRADPGRDAGRSAAPRLRQPLAGGDAATRGRPHAALGRDDPRGPAAYLVATKIEAFLSRGAGDHLAASSERRRMSTRPCRTECES